MVGAVLALIGLALGLIQNVLAVLLQGLSALVLGAIGLILGTLVPGLLRGIRAVAALPAKGVRGLVRKVRGKGRGSGPSRSTGDEPRGSAGGGPEDAQGDRHGVVEP